MQHVGPEVEQADRLEDGPAEEDEAAAVVVVVTPCTARIRVLVKPAPLLRIVAVEVVRLLDKEDWNVRVGKRGAPEPAFDCPGTHGDPEAVSGRLKRPAGITHGSIHRHDDGALMTAAGQRGRQGAGDVGQATGLGETDHFGGGEQDADGLLPLKRRSADTPRRLGQTGSRGTLALD